MRLGVRHLVIRLLPRPAYDSFAPDPRTFSYAMLPQVQWIRRRPCPSLSRFLYLCPRAQLSARCFGVSCWLQLSCSLLLALFTRNPKYPRQNALCLTPLTANVPRKACQLSIGTPRSHPPHGNTHLGWRSATSCRINFQVNRRFRTVPPRQAPASQLLPKILRWLRTLQLFIRRGCNRHIIAKN